MDLDSSLLLMENLEHHVISRWSQCCGRVYSQLGAWGLVQHAISSHVPGRALSLSFPSIRDLSDSMVRVQVMSDNTLFVQWLIAYVLLHPYVNLMAAAVSLPPRGTNVDSPSGARSDNASTECGMRAPCDS